MKAAKTKKKLKEMSYPPQKKLLKGKRNSITPAKTNALITQTSSECLKLTIRTYQKRKKEPKNKAWATSKAYVQKNIKSILLVSADLSNKFTSIILETDQRKIYPS